MLVRGIRSLVLVTLGYRMASLQLDLTYHGPLFNILLNTGMIDLVVNLNPGLGGLENCLQVIKDY